MDYDERPLHHGAAAVLCQGDDPMNDDPISHVSVLTVVQLETFGRWLALQELPEPWAEEWSAELVVHQKDRTLTVRHECLKYVQAIVDELRVLHRALSYLPEMKNVIEKMRCGE